MDAKTAKAGTAASMPGEWLVVAVSHGREVSADFVASIRCNGQWAAEDVAEFIRQRGSLGAKVFHDPPPQPKTWKEIGEEYLAELGDDED
jgi:hypothetical protein